MTTDQRRKMIAKLQILITQQGVDKESLYYSFGVNSSKDMTDIELIECVDLLEGKAPQSTYSAKAKTAEGAIRQVRSNVLSVITKSPTARNARDRGLGVPNDWMYINPFIKKRCGKTLSQMSIAEMERLKMQLFKMRDKGWSWKEKKDEEIAGGQYPRIGATALKQPKQPKVNIPLPLIMPTGMPS